MSLTVTKTTNCIVITDSSNLNIPVLVPVSAVSRVSPFHLDNKTGGVAYSSDKGVGKPQDVITFELHNGARFNLDINAVTNQATWLAPAPNGLINAMNTVIGWL